MNTLTTIIPAYNEERSLAQAINPHRGFSDNQASQLIVACNACHDGSFAIASQAAWAIALDIKSPGKSNAINIALARRLPDSHVMVQDADVVISAEHLVEIHRAIRDENFALAAPCPRYTKSNSWWVTRYYRFLEQTNAFKNGLIGTGVYIVHKDFVDRVFPIPADTIADDGYVKFTLANERFIKLQSVVEVKPPNSIYSLIKIKTRSQLGNLYSTTAISDEKNRNSGKGLIHTMLATMDIIGFVIYSGIQVICKFRAKRQFKNGNMKWERDTSTR